MPNFKDFDLDLKKVNGSNEESMERALTGNLCVSIITVSVQTIVAACTASDRGECLTDNDCQNSVKCTPGCL